MGGPLFLKRPTLPCFSTRPFRIGLAAFLLFLLAGGAAPVAEPSEVVAVVPGHWPPQYALDDSGRPVGFAIDVMEAVAARAGLRVRYTIAETFPEAYDLLRSGQADLIPNMGIVPSRRELFGFTAPVETFVVSLFVRSEYSAVSGLDDLAGRRVATVKYNVAVPLLSGRDDIDLVIYPDVHEALFKLLAGHVDALAYPRPVVTRLLAESGVADRVLVAGPPLAEIKRGIAVHGNDSALLARLDAAVADYVGSPGYRDVYRKWYGTQDKDWLTEDIVWTLVALVAFTALAMGYWRYRTVLGLTRRLRASIWDRERAEVALSASEERLRVREAYFRALIENATDVITVLSEDGTILFESASVETQFGYRTDELIGLNAMDFIHPDDRPRAREALGRAVANVGTAAATEYRVRHKNGEWRIVSSIGKNALNNLSVAGIVVISRDITEAKSIEEQLRHAQKMEAIGRLTGGVAHDFNNLLAIAMGNLELVEEGLADRPKLRDLSHRALEAAQRGANLTQRLLAYSRKQPLRPQVVDLNALIANTVELLGRTLGETIEIETVLPDGLWPVPVDPHQLENALLNLAVNARDAMRKGGRLTIETANTDLDAAYADSVGDLAPGTYVVLAVSDTGGGIEADVLPDVFEPFFTTKDVGEGSGLGLSMVYGFARQSGGHATIYSESGQGTTVRLYLPRADAGDTAAPPEPAVGDMPRGAGERILVVEDNADVRATCLRLLADLGYRTVAVPDAASALAKLETVPEIELLFTDIVLPGGMSGAELAPEAKRRRPALKVLYTSGYTENAIVHQGRLDDGADLIEKPYRKDQLASKLRNVLDNVLDKGGAV